MEQQYPKRVKDLMTDEEGLDLCHLSIFLAGPPGVGKTSTRNRLLNVNSTHHGGDMLSMQSANCIQGLNMIVNGEETEWVSSSAHSQEAKLLCNYLRGYDLLVEQSASNYSHLAAKSRSNERRAQKSLSTSLQATPSQAKNVSTVQQDRIQAFAGRLQKLIKNKHHFDLLLLLGSTLLSVNIIRDDPGLLEMLPALNIGPAMYFIFLDLDKELDKTQSIPTDPNTIYYQADASILQTLSSIASVHNVLSQVDVSKAMDHNEKFQMIQPVVALIGTHKERLSTGCEQRLVRISKALSNSESDEPNSSISGRCFAVNTSAGSNIEPIRDFIKKISHTHFRNTSLPIHSKWLLLSLVLRREHRIVSKQDCLQIATSLEMTGEEVELSLSYLHHCTGILLYYPDLPDEWFNNHIICSPQVILDSIYKLITSLITSHSNSEKRVKVAKNGQFTIKSLEEYAESPMKEELIPAEQLVKLCHHLNFLSPITHTVEDGSKRFTYFMPASLECALPDKLIDAPQSDDNNPEPVYITFSCGYAPTGTFCGLITRLVSVGPNGILGMTWELAEEDPKRNCVSFYVAKTNKVTLISHKTCFEIRVTRNTQQTSLHDLCLYVLSALLYTLKSLYSQLVTQIAFQCPCPDHKSAQGVNHLCILTDNIWIQFLCESKTVTLNQNQQVWLGKVLTKL